MPLHPPGAFLSCVAKCVLWRRRDRTQRARRYPNFTLFQNSKPARELRPRCASRSVGGYGAFPLAVESIADFTPEYGRASCLWSSLPVSLATGVSGAMGGGIILRWSWREKEHCILRRRQHCPRLPGLPRRARPSLRPSLLHSDNHIDGVGPASFPSTLNRLQVRREGPQQVHER